MFSRCCNVFFSTPVSGSCITASDRASFDEGAPLAGQIKSPQHSLTVCQARGEGAGLVRTGRTRMSAWKINAHALKAWKKCRRLSACSCPLQHRAPASGMRQKRHKIGLRRQGRFSEKHKQKEKSAPKPPSTSCDCQSKTVSALARRSIRYARTKGYFWGLGRLLVTTSKDDNPRHENEDVRSCLNR